MFRSPGKAPPSPGTSLSLGGDRPTLSGVFGNRYIYDSGALQRNKTKAVTAAVVEDRGIQPASSPGNTTEEVGGSEEEKDGKQRHVSPSLNVAEP